MLVLNIVLTLTLVITGQANAVPDRRYQASNRRSTRGGEEVYGTADFQLSTETRDNNFNLQLFDELPLYESKDGFSQEEAQVNTVGEYNADTQFTRGAIGTNTQYNSSPAAVFGYGDQHTSAQATGSAEVQINGRIQGTELVKDTIAQTYVPYPQKNIWDAETQTNSTVATVPKKENTQFNKRQTPPLLQKRGPSSQNLQGKFPPRCICDNIRPSHLRQSHPPNILSNNLGSSETMHKQYGRTVNKDTYDEVPLPDYGFPRVSHQLPKGRAFKIVSIEDAIKHGLPYLPIKVNGVDSALAEINIFGSLNHLALPIYEHQQGLQNKPLVQTTTDQSTEFKLDESHQFDNLTQTNAAIQPNSETQYTNQQVHTLDAYGGEDATAGGEVEVKSDNDIEGEIGDQANEIVETNNDNDYNADTQSKEIVQPNGKTQISSSEQDDVAFQSRFGSYSNIPSQHVDLQDPATKYSGTGLYDDATGNVIQNRFSSHRVHRHPNTRHQG